MDQAIEAGCAFEQGLCPLRVADTEGDADPRCCDSYTGTAALSQGQAVAFPCFRDRYNCVGRSSWADQFGSDADDDSGEAMPLFDADGDADGFVKDHDADDDSGVANPLFVADGDSHGSVHLDFENPFRDIGTASRAQQLFEELGHAQHGADDDCLFLRPGIFMIATSLISAASTRQLEDNLHSLMDIGEQVDNELARRQQAALDVGAGITGSDDGSIMLPLSGGGSSNSNACNDDPEYVIGDMTDNSVTATLRSDRVRALICDSDIVGGDLGEVTDIGEQVENELVRRPGKARGPRGGRRRRPRHGQAETPIGPCI